MLLRLRITRTSAMTISGIFCLHFSTVEGSIDAHLFFYGLWQKQTLNSPKTRPVLWWQTLIISLCQTLRVSLMRCVLSAAVCLLFYADKRCIRVYNDCYDCSSHSLLGWERAAWFKWLCFSLFLWPQSNAFLVCWSLSSVGSFTSRLNYEGSSFFLHTDRISTGARHSGKGLVSTKKALACKAIPTRHPQNAKHA